MASERNFELVLWGATGFTGKLTAEHLLRRHGAGGSATLRWAIGGRNRAKLEAVRKQLADETGVATDALPIVVGDSDDDAFVADLAQQAKVVCSTVGPYAKYGSKLVAACAKHGTDYCDLTGEAQWMRKMIDAHHAEAERSGARIVFTCGFDCIPSDIGAFFLQREMQRLHGVSCSKIQLRVKAFRGGASGGTIASMLNIMEEAQHDPSVLQIMKDPYALNPAGQRSGPDRAERITGWYDADFAQWVAPFVMAGINTKVVRRSNALLDYAYGREFRYDEGVLSGTGAGGFLKASATGLGTGVMMTAMSVGPLRRLVAGRLPSPGEGPSPAQREAGFFDLELRGEHPTDRNKSLHGRVTGDRDPGYGSTSKMLGESAVCLARDARTTGGGCLTPASAMGEALLARLGEHAGVQFALE